MRLMKLAAVGAGTWLNIESPYPFTVQIRGDQSRGPVHAEDMKSVVKAGRGIESLTIVDVVSIVFPMRGRTDIPVNNTSRNGRGIPHFHDVQLTTEGPANLAEIIPQRPECRPQSIGQIRNLDARFDPAVLESELVFRPDTGRGEAAPGFTRRGFPDRNHQVSVFDTDVFRSVRVFL